MGDSDDEFEKRRGRDKFRRERNDYDRRGAGGDRSWDDRSRGDWPGRKRDRGEFDFDRGRGVYRSPQRYSSPPTPKRMKKDWEDGEPGAAGSAWQGDGAAAAAGRHDMDYPTQPPIMTFKAFLGQQDDNISDDEAIKKYQEYKMDFKKQQINEFFLQHKEEEWFRTKYLPEEHEMRKAESRVTLRRRCEVFTNLVQLGWLEKLSVDTRLEDDLIRFMDAAVIFLEGGSEFDLKCLDEEPPSEPVKSISETLSKTEETANTSKTADDDDDGEIHEDGDSQKGSSKPKKSSPHEEAKKKRRSRGNYEDDDDDDDSGAASHSSDSEDETPKKDADNSNAISKSAASSENNSPIKNEKEVVGSNSIVAEDGETSQQSTQANNAAPSASSTTEDDNFRPKPYHRTQSIFLRNLAPAITKAEVEAMCRKYGGYLRVALQDPAPERKFYRRGWVTFDSTINIKDICWKLTNIRLRDCELGAIVNRELKQRVRPVNGTTAHRQVAKNDVKYAAKIIQTFDKIWGLWEEECSDKKDVKPDITLGLVSNNPMLKNITDYLVDEGNFEEEAYLGQPIDEPPKEGNPEVVIDRDEELLKVLDRMILYLRVVHSFDYYSAVEYPSEDEMPHRCGIIHARGLPPPNRLTQGDIDDWMRMFENKITHWLKAHNILSDDDAKRLGLKDPDTEVEKFIQANTQEIAKDKWLCPLSGKKFKGPEFVRKHILNKNGDKVEEVKREAHYFNNYLRDPKRPQLPEHPANKNPQVVVPAARPHYDMPPPQPFHPQPHFYNQGGGNYQGGFGFNRPFYGRGRGPMRGFHTGPNFRGGYDNPYKNDFRRDNNRGGFDRFPQRRDRTRPDPRGIVEYRDLDSNAEESEAFFIMDKA